jgi:hypothetical protein
MAAKHDDIIYASWIFRRENGATVEGGPASTSPDRRIDDKFEMCYPDWSHWASDMKDHTMGHLTRGCPNRCEWCVVHKNEGCETHQVAEISDIWHGEKNLTIHDANLLALPDRPKLLKLLNDLADTKANINFEQGLDCRRIDAEIACAISKIRIKRIQLACDHDGMIPPIKRACELIWDAKPTANIACYVFIDWRKPGWYSSAMRRLNALSEVDIRCNKDTFIPRKKTPPPKNGKKPIKEKQRRLLRLTPFAMVYERDRAPRKARDLQRWVNRTEIYATTEFKDYKRNFKKIK